MAHSRTMFKFGATTVLTHNDAFADEYSNGFVGYPQSTPQPLTDTMLYELIVTNILDVHASNEWNTGYILGAFDGLRKGRTPVPVLMLPLSIVGMLPSASMIGDFVRASYRDKKTDRLTLPNRKQAIP